jgi:hypothetical protein
LLCMRHKFLDAGLCNRATVLVSKESQFRNRFSSVLLSFAMVYPMRVGPIWDIGIIVLVKCFWGIRNGESLKLSFPRGGFGCYRHTTRSGEFVDDVLEARNSVSDNVKVKSVYIHVNMVKKR